MNELNAISNLLFTPGNRPERFAHAKEAGSDGIVIDLEDAIAWPDKDAARAMVVEYLQHSTPSPGFFRCVRINSMKTPAGLKDLSALIDNHLQPDAIMVPKAESTAEILMLDELFKPRHMPYVALIETARGLQHAAEIAAASPHLVALSFGGADYAAELGAQLDWEPMLVARSQIVQAAAIAGIVAWDVPYLNLHEADDGGLIQETRRVKALGFSGKLAIHPKHIKAIRQVFTPSSEDITRAQRLVEAYHAAGGNACQIDGKMIDVPVLRAAQRVLAQAS
jgi:citrate lyase beta subunit